MISALLTVLLILVAAILILLIIVLQHGNEGGIATAFGSGNSAGFFGASGGVDFIVKGTWIAGALFFALSLGLAWWKSHEHFGVGREIDREGDVPAAESPAPIVTTPAGEHFPTPVPGAGSEHPPAAHTAAPAEAPPAAHTAAPAEAPPAAHTAAPAQRTEPAAHAVPLGKPKSP